MISFNIKKQKKTHVTIGDHTFKLLNYCIFEKNLLEPGFRNQDTRTKTTTITMTTLNNSLL